MKNITVAITDKTYKNARIWAANNDTSVSAVVQIFLEGMTGFKPLPDMGKKIARGRRVALALDKTSGPLPVRPVAESADAPAPKLSPGGADAPAAPAKSSVDYLLKILQHLCSCELPQTKQTTSSDPQPN